MRKNQHAPHLEFFHEHIGACLCLYALTSEGSCSTTKLRLLQSALAPHHTVRTKPERAPSVPARSPASRVYNLAPKSPKTLCNCMMSILSTGLNFTTSIAYDMEIPYL